MELKRLDPNDPRPEFSCGDADLDEYFARDSIEGGRELIAVTYAFIGDDGCVHAFVSLSNDSIKREDTPRSVWERITRPIPRPKRYASTPTVKIGRLGVCHKHRGQGVGTWVLDYLKVWFTRGNKTGCRFLVVDAYNKPEALRFYQKNGFEFLTQSDCNDETRIMYFDLKTFSP